MYFFNIYITFLGGINHFFYVFLSLDPVFRRVFVQFYLFRLCLYFKFIHIPNYVFSCVTLLPKCFHEPASDNTTA